MSKLLCFACWESLACLRELTGVYFTTRGTHGKTYFPWKYPDVELSDSKCRNVAPQIYQYFFARMAERYTTCIDARQKVPTSKKDKRKSQAFLGEDNRERGSQFFGTLKRMRVGPRTS